MKGRVIVLEGINGCGKSTTAEMIRDIMVGNGIRVKLYHDPGDTAVGEAIRKLVKDPAVKMQPLTQMMMYSAARYELACEFAPLIADGVHIVLDRWWPSTYAYQGAGGVDRDFIIDTARFLTPPGCHLTYNLTFWLDVNFEIAYERSGAMKPGGGIENGSDRFEAQGVEFMKKLAAGYHRLCQLGVMRRIAASGFKSSQDAGEYLWANCIKPEIGL